MDITPDHVQETAANLAQEVLGWGLSMVPVSQQVQWSRLFLPLWIQQLEHLFMAFLIYLADTIGTS